jgi:hypothetical protein
VVGVPALLHPHVKMGYDNYIRDWIRTLAIDHPFRRDFDTSGLHDSTLEGRRCGEMLTILSIPTNDHSSSQGGLLEILQPLSSRASICRAAREKLRK